MIQLDYDLMLDKLEMGVKDELYLDCNLVVSHSTEAGIEIDRMEIPLTMDITHDIQMVCGLTEESEYTDEELEANLGLLQHFRDVISELILKTERKLND